MRYAVEKGATNFNWALAAAAEKGHIPAMREAHSWERTNSIGHYVGQQNLVK